ncbi:MAG: GntR family transcriptional regulator, partial [Rhodospirillales bacterium]
MASPVTRDWKLSDQAYERILAKIVDGQFPENSKLPAEIELSKQLEVSRPVLRQALARLRQDEVISSRQGSGSFVMRRPASQMLDFAPVGSIADIQRCFEFRAAVEGAGAALAAER